VVLLTTNVYLPTYSKVRKTYVIKGVPLSSIGMDAPRHVGRLSGAGQSHRPELHQLGSRDQQDIHSPTMASQFLSMFESTSLLGLSSDREEKPL
jgi:hypothetical protein